MIDAMLVWIETTHFEVHGEHFSLKVFGRVTRVHEPNGGYTVLLPDGTYTPLCRTANQAIAAAQRALKSAMKRR